MEILKCVNPIMSNLLLEKENLLFSEWCFKNNIRLDILYFFDGKIFCVD